MTILMDKKTSKHSKAIIFKSFLLISGVSQVFFCSTLPASAFELKFTGGTCEFSDFATGGLLTINSCTNKTKSNVNDIHLSISYLDEDGNAIPKLNKVIEKDFETVLPEGIYKFPILTLVYNNNEVFKESDEVPDKDKVRLSGYWTLKGSQVGVPEPITILGSATALGIGCLLKLKSSKKKKS